jgi:hypothetical protein
MKFLPNTVSMFLMASSLTQVQTLVSSVPGPLLFCLVDVQNDILHSKPSKKKSLGDRRVSGHPKWISKVYVVANDGVFAVQLVQLFVE